MGGILVGIFIASIIYAQSAIQQNNEENCFMAERLKKARSIAVSIRTFIFQDDEIWSRIGSGWIDDKGGLIVTRQSVIHGGDSIEVTFFNGRKTPAWVLNCDPVSQVALLKINDALPYCPPSSHCSDIKPQDCIILLGNSLGVFPSVTLGHIIDFQENGFFLFHGSVPPGNTGGPLFNREGALVGMLAGRRKIESYQDPVGVGVPITTIDHVMQRFFAFAHNQSGWIGLCVVDITHKENQGVRVVNVIPDSPADRASICKGDTILAIDGQSILNANELAQHIKTRSPKEQIMFDVRRNDVVKSCVVEIGCMPIKK
ncbi:serine protease [bacterium]|nr:serine protease [bacterium]